jgi:hypothetical protein
VLVVEFLMDISVTSWTQLVEPAATTASNMPFLETTKLLERESLVVERAKQQHQQQQINV